MMLIKVQNLYFALEIVDFLFLMDRLLENKTDLSKFCC